MTRLVHLIGFGLLFCAAVALQAAALIWRRTGTAGDAVSVLCRRRVSRIVLLSAWLWLGWHLFARGDFG